MGRLPLGISLLKAFSRFEQISVLNESTPLGEPTHYRMKKIAAIVAAMYC